MTGWPSPFMGRYMWPDNGTMAQYKFMITASPNSIGNMGNAFETCHKKTWISQSIFRGKSYRRTPTDFIAQTFGLRHDETIPARSPTWRLLDIAANSASLLCTSSCVTFFKVEHFVAGSHARARCTSCSSKGKKCIPSTSVLAVWSRVCVDCRKDLAKHSCQLLLFCKILLRVMTLGNILSPLPGLCWRRTLVSEKNAADISLRSLSGAGWSRPVLLSRGKRWHGTVHWTNTCLVFIIIPHIHTLLQLAILDSCTYCIYTQTRTW